MALKVFDLQCDAGHLFEGWFASHDDYDSQQTRGLIACPLCQSAQVKKLPSAPHINSSRSALPVADVQSTEVSAGPVAQQAQGAQATEGALALQQLQAAVLSQLRQAVGRAEDVGPAFASEARAIHDGESQARPIRGTASVQERQALADDGIAVMAIPDFLADDRLN